MSNSENINSMIYSSGEGRADIKIPVDDDTVWATQKDMAGIFDVSAKTISEHLGNIYESQELSKDSTVRNFQIVQNEGGREIKRKIDHYSLDAIISVGYRVNSIKATQFRIWATNTLKQYITDGFVINEARLREDPEQLNKLAVKIRELRANEKNIYASVRECFKLASSDYEPSSKEVRRFYSLLQDKFHHAITGLTSSRLILDRANHVDKKMGLVHTKSDIPTLKEAGTGKNYLNENEIYRLHLLSEQFLLYAESTALKGENMTMKQLHTQLDNLLTLNGYPVFDGYKNYLKDQAIAHAEKEYKTYLEIKKLEYLDVNVDLDAFYLGEYNDFKEETGKVRVQDLNKAIQKKNEALRIEEEMKAEPSEFNKSLETALAFNPKD